MKEEDEVDPLTAAGGGEGRIGSSAELGGEDMWPNPSDPPIPPAAPAPPPPAAWMAKNVATACSTDQPHDCSSEMAVVDEGSAVTDWKGQGGQRNTRVSVSARMRAEWAS